MANAVEDSSSPKGPSLVIQIAVLLAMTAAAIGFGWLSGGYLNGGESTAKPVAHTEGKAEGGDEATKLDTVVDLSPITTNLTAPSTTWVRLEVSLVLDQPQSPEFVETIHQDMLAFIRTLKLHQIEGSSGLQHLKADLDERANIRSDGHVKQVLIRTLLFE